MKKWYAVYTKPSSEKKVVESLVKKGFDAYCPLQQVKKNWAAHLKKSDQQPVFPSYVFVKATQEQLSQLKELPNVLTLVFWLGEPAIIRDIEIEMIQRFLNEHPTVQVERAPVAMGEMVKVISNPFIIENEGDVMFIRNQVEKVFLPSLGFVIVADKNVQLRIKSTSLNFSKQLTDHKHGIQQ